MCTFCVGKNLKLTASLAKNTAYTDKNIVQ